MESEALHATLVSGPSALSKDEVLMKKVIKDYNENNFNKQEQEEIVNEHVKHTCLLQHTNGSY